MEEKSETFGYNYKKINIFGLKRRRKTVVSTVQVLASRKRFLKARLLLLKELLIHQNKPKKQNMIY